MESEQHITTCSTTVKSGSESSVFQSGGIYEDLWVEAFIESVCGNSYLHKVIPLKVDKNTLFVISVMDP